MTDQHSPEPWRLEDTGLPLFIYDSNTQEFPEGNHVAEVPNGLRDSAKRIVACVNACRGIPTEELEKLAIETDMPLVAGWMQWLGYHMRPNGK